MGSPNLLREKVQEELKAAGICFFRAANLAGRFYYHSVHGDSVRRRCNRYSPTTTQAGEVPAKFGEGRAFALVSVYTARTCSFACSLRLIFGVDRGR